jgi:hypothetical protein
METPSDVLLKRVVLSQPWELATLGNLGQAVTQRKASLEKEASLFEYEDVMFCKAD